MTAPDVGQELSAALDEAARLIETGDAPAAAAALEQVVARCQAASAELLSVEAQRHVRSLLERCQRAEASLRARFMEELAHAGTSRRAHTAYDR